MVYLTLLSGFRVLGIAAGLLAMRLVLTGRGDAAWGDVVFLLSALNLGSILTLAGQENYLLSRPTESLSDDAFAASVNAVHLWLPLVVIGAIAHVVFGSAPAAPLVWATVMLPLFSVWRISMRFYQKREWRVWFSLLHADTIYQVAFLVAIWLWLPRSDLSPLAMSAWTMLAIAVTSSIPAALRWRRQNLGFDRERFRLGLPFLLGGSLLLLMGWFDSFVLGLLRSRAEVGLYNVVFRLASIATLFLGLTNAIVAPRLSTLYRSDRVEFERLVRLANRTSAAVATVLTVLVVSQFGTVVTLLGVAEDNVQLLTVPGFVLLGSYLVNSLCGNVGYVLQMTEHVDVFNRYIAQAAAINVVLNLSLIPTAGLVGAAVATGISMLWWNIASWIFVRHVLRVRLI